MSSVKGSKHTKVHGFKSEFNTQLKWRHILYIHDAGQGLWLHLHALRPQQNRFVIYTLQTRQQEPGWLAKGTPAGRYRREKREENKNPRPNQKTMLQRSRQKNVHVTVLLTDIALVSYVTLVDRLMWAVALFKYWIICLGIVILLILWGRKGCQYNFLTYIIQVFFTMVHNFTLRSFC